MRNQPNEQCHTFFCKLIADIERESHLGIFHNLISFLVMAFHNAPIPKCFLYRAVIELHAIMQQLPQDIVSVQTGTKFLHENRLLGLKYTQLQGKNGLCFH